MSVACLCVGGPKQRVWNIGRPITSIVVFGSVLSLDPFGLQVWITIACGFWGLVRTSNFDLQHSYINITEGCMFGVVKEEDML